MRNKIICIIIGSIYLLSGIGKVGNVVNFEILIASYGFESFQIFAPFIILGELVLGVCLVLWIKPKLMSLLSMILLLIFTVVFTYAHFKNGINDCGCFGMLGANIQTPTLTYIRNILLLGLSLFVFASSQKESLIVENWKKYIMITFFIPIIFICGFTFRIPKNLYKTKQHQYINKPIEETIFANYLQSSMNSTCLIYCFSYACPHCWNSIENYKSFKSSGIVDSIIAVSLVSADTSMNFQDRNVFNECFGADLVNYEIINNELIQTIITSLPISFYVENDTIKHVIKSELPSPFIFQKFIKNSD